MMVWVVIVWAVVVGLGVAWGRAWARFRENLALADALAEQEGGQP
jgi:hypothetical protein